MDCICAICFDACLTNKNKACAVETCGHMFHISCLVNWEAKSGKRVCAICSVAYHRIVHLYPSSSTDEVHLIPFANPETTALKNRVAELEKQLGAVQLTSPTNQCASTEMDLKRKNVLLVSKCQALEDTLADMEETTNTIKFKLSMYEEMFGRECSDHFDKVIRGQSE